MKYIIRVTKEFGRGVYAKHDLKKGTIVEVAYVLVLNELDTLTIFRTDLQYYTFVYDKAKGQDCLVLGIGELFNHADQANVSYELIKANGRERMFFKTTQDVKKGKQLFIDYNADTKVDTTEYKGRNLL